MEWPPYARIEADGYQLGSDSDVARDTLDDGLIRQEKRYSSAMRTRVVRGWLDSDADLIRFREWVAAAGFGWLRIVTPRTAQSDLCVSETARAASGTR